MSTSCTDANRAGESSSSLFDTVSSAFSSFFPTAHADDGKDDDEEEGGEDEEKEGEGEEEAEDEDDDDEPEDQLPGLLEQCQEKECSSAKHHFLECQERVEGGNGFKDENCVEEFFHLMHCSTVCAAPRLFSELK